MSSRNRRASLVVILAVAIGGAGCIEREGRPVNPCTQVTVAQAIQVNNVDKVDLLFMIDNSNSMTEEQASLAAEIPNMIEILTTGDFNQDGDVEDAEDFDPVRNLNVGVITSDMGTGGFTVPTCSRSDFGDDGILRTQGRTDMTGCSATYPNILNFQEGGDSTQFARDVTCVANMGTGGCGFEQQLEAILKALSPTAAQPWTRSDFVPVGTPGAPSGLDRPFFRMTNGHGNTENDGFARENSVLAVIPLTDEEDCSAKDPELFNTMSATYTAQLNLRCFSHAEAALHPVGRYVEGLLQLRAREQLLIYAPIVGIPPDLAPAPGDRPDWDRLVGNTDVRDPRMVEMVDPAMPTQLVPSCNTARGIAFPPIRIVRVAQQLQERGAGVTVQSICQESYANALREIIVQIRSALGAACLPRQLNVEADGSVSCDVLAVMPPDASCQAGYEPKVDEDGNPIIEVDDAGAQHAVCVIPQLVPTPENVAAGVAPTGDGWYYDYYTEEGRENCQEGSNPYQRIAFAGNQPSSGVEVRLECFLAVQGTGTDDVQIGTFCDPASTDPATNACGSAMAPEGNTPLTCDPVTRACGVSCGSDADCRSAGLIGYVCDSRPLSEVDPGNTSGDAYNFCVNPTCS